MIKGVNFTHVIFRSVDIKVYTWDPVTKWSTVNKRAGIKIKNHIYHQLSSTTSKDWGRWSIESWWTELATPEQILFNATQLPRNLRIETKMLLHLSKITALHFLKIQTCICHHLVLPESLVGKDREFTYSARSCCSTNSSSLKPNWSIKLLVICWSW